MRGDRYEGRFDINHETESMYEGMHDDLQVPVGFSIDWFHWDQNFAHDPDNNVIDDVYDVGRLEEDAGKLWKLPFKLKCLALRLVRGGNVMNDRGFYSTDTLSITVNAGEIRTKIPEILRDEPNQYMKDRIYYRGQVFYPVRINPKGAFSHRWAVVSIDCLEVNPEELVGDRQFLKFAEKALPDFRTIEKDGI
jgi:hypothetical protein